MNGPRPRGPFWLEGVTAGFPPVEYALEDPNGLLAVGGDLSAARLLDAYRQGIFPWYSEGQPILWWSPDPRTVLFPERLRISRSLRKTLRKQPFRITLDSAFGAVIRACAAPRPQQNGTWILPEVEAAYLRLHHLGHAHSVEAWIDDELVGGLYGVAIGRAFFGESMFSLRTDASKVAFVQLVRQLAAWGFGVIDCQIHSTHLASLGAESIPRHRFNSLVADYRQRPFPPGRWQLSEEGFDG